MLPGKIVRDHDTMRKSIGKSNRHSQRSSLPPILGTCEVLRLPGRMREAGNNPAQKATRRRVHVRFTTCFVFLCISARNCTGRTRRDQKRLSGSACLSLRDRLAAEERHVRLDGQRIAGSHRFLAEANPWRRQGGTHRPGHPQDSHIPVRLAQSVVDPCGGLATNPPVHSGSLRTSLSSRPAAGRRYGSGRVEQGGLLWGAVPRGISNHRDHYSLPSRPFPAACSGNPPEPFPPVKSPLTLQRIFTYILVTYHVV